MSTARPVISIIFMAFYFFAGARNCQLIDAGIGERVTELLLLVSVIQWIDLFAKYRQGDKHNCCTRLHRFAGNQKKTSECFRSC